MKTPICVTTSGISVEESSIKFKNLILKLVKVILNLIEINEAHRNDRALLQSSILETSTVMAY